MSLSALDILVLISPHQLICHIGKQNSMVWEDRRVQNVYRTQRDTVVRGGRGVPEQLSGSKKPCGAGT